MRHQQPRGEMRVGLEAVTWQRSGDRPRRIPEQRRSWPRLLAPPFARVRGETRLLELPGFHCVAQRRPDRATRETCGLRAR